MTTRPDRTDVEVAAQYFQEGRARFIDAHSKGKYDEDGRRIPGAVHAASGAGAELAELLRTLPNEKILIAYCDEPNQAAIAQIARRARQIGIGDVSILSGGFDAWKQADLPLEPIEEGHEEKPSSRAA